MNKVLLDTDIVSEMMKQRNLSVISQATAYRSIVGYYTTSIITIMEVVKGWKKLSREDKINQFLSRWTNEEILTMGVDDSILAGRIEADLESSGNFIGYPDVMIAAITIQNNFTLVTGNTNHYQKIQALGYNLTLRNWRLTN